MRSVGLVEVTVPESSGIKGASDAAVRKGQEVGCQLLIEHAAFEELGGRTGQVILADHTSVILVHGAAPHVGAAPHPRASLTAQFDCVIELAALRSAYTAVLRKP